MRGKALRAQGSARSRFAVVVSKKVAGSAVMRNRLRRWVFEAIAGSPSPRTSYDAVLMISKKYTTCSDVRADVGAALQRLVDVPSRT